MKKKMLRATVWFMGLPCSGKTSLADRLYRSPQTIHIDGDCLRGKGKLCSDLTFTPEDRMENLRRAACVAELMNLNGFNVTASFITPTKEAQDLIRNTIENLILVYVKCPVEVCAERDVKGMYKQAREGKISNFTGISAPFHEPENPDITVETDKLDTQECIRILEEEIPKYWRGF